MGWSADRRDYVRNVEVVGSSPITSTAVEITTFGLVNGHFVFPIARQPKASHSNLAMRAHAPRFTARGSAVRRPRPILKMRCSVVAQFEVPG